MQKRRRQMKKNQAKDEEERRANKKAITNWDGVRKIRTSIQDAPLRQDCLSVVFEGEFLLD